MKNKPVPRCFQWNERCRRAGPGPGGDREGSRWEASTHGRGAPTGHRSRASAPQRGACNRGRCSCAPLGRGPPGLGSGGCAALPTGYLHARLRRELPPRYSTGNSEEPKVSSNRDPRRVSAGLLPATVAVTELGWLATAGEFTPNSEIGFTGGNRENGVRGHSVRSLAGKKFR